MPFIDYAYAEGAAQNAAPQDAGMTMIFMFGFLALFVFMIWSQNKRAKQQKAMVDSLKEGDEVMMSSGILGRVKKMDDNYLSVEIASNTVVQVQRSAVQNVLPKGTIKN